MNMNYNTLQDRVAGAVELYQPDVEQATGILLGNVTVIPYSREKFFKKFSDDINSDNRKFINENHFVGKKLLTYIFGLIPKAVAYIPRLFMDNISHEHPILPPLGDEVTLYTSNNPKFDKFNDSEIALLSLVCLVDISYDKNKRDEHNASRHIRQPGKKKTFKENYEDTQVEYNKKRDNISVTVYSILKKHDLLVDLKNREMYRELLTRARTLEETLK